MSVNKIRVVTRGRKARKKRGLFPPVTFGPVHLNVKHSDRAIDPLAIEDPFVGPPDITSAQLFSLEGNIDSCIDFFRYCSGFGKPSMTHAAVLKDWAHHFRADAKRLMRIGPFLQRNLRRIVNCENDVSVRQVAASLNAWADFLESLPVPHRTTKNYTEVECVYDMCRAYIKHTGKPHYKEVTARMFEEFPKHFKKEPIDDQKRDWAKDKFERWKQLRKDPKAWERQKRARAQREIF